MFGLKFVFDMRGWWLRKGGQNLSSKRSALHRLHTSNKAKNMRKKGRPGLSSSSSVGEPFDTRPPRWKSVIWDPFPPVSPSTWPATPIQLEFSEGKYPEAVSFLQTYLISQVRAGHWPFTSAKAWTEFRATNRKEKPSHCIICRRDCPFQTSERGGGLEKVCLKWAAAVDRRVQQQQGNVEESDVGRGRNYEMKRMWEK